MKKFIICIICITAITLLGWYLVKHCPFLSAPYYVINETITVVQPKTENANLYQNNAHVKILCAGERLFYYIRSWPGSLGSRSRFDGKLCVIEDGKITACLDASSLYGSDNTFVYCCNKESLIAYDAQSGQIKTLVSSFDDQQYNVSLSSEGTLYVIAKETGVNSYIIKNGKLIETSESKTPAMQYEINGKQFSINDGKLLCQGTDISEKVGNSSYRALIPYQDGLLLINDGNGNLLYYINSDGDITPLLPEFPCMYSKSCINFCEDYVFVSFERWESYDESGIGVKKFKDDSLEGTYRINMEDFSVDKISDNVYSGMFIFDNTHIYACNRYGDIYQLDFDGNVLHAIID